MDAKPGPSRDREARDHCGLLACAVACILSLAAIHCSADGVGSESGERAADGPRTQLQQDFRARVDELNQQTGARQLASGTLREKLARNEDIVLLDIREASEHRVAALPGAKLVPPSEVESFAGDLPAGATIVTYCTVGYRSGLAAVTLEKRIGRPVFNLDGGIIAWFNDGGTVVDAGGEETGKIDAFSAEWEQYVERKRMANDE